jgi:hypothetical protein
MVTLMRPGEPVIDWWRAHWRVLLQTLGYAAIAIAGGLLWLPLGVALAGVALVLLSNGW